MAITKSYTFTNNTIIDPDEVNQNFDDVIASLKTSHHRDADGTDISYQDIATGWGLVPAGGVILWNGLISAIPTGYVFCNGANGTKDMRDKFVIGAGQDSGGTYDNGDTGGASTINIYHSHSATTGGGGSHSHTINDHTHTYSGSGTTGTASALSNDVNTGDENQPRTPNHTHGFSWSGTTSGASDRGTSDPGNHTHSVSTDNQLSSAQSIIPPFIAMVWIQKS